MSVVPITTLPPTTTTNLHCRSLPRIQSLSPNSIRLLSKLRRRILPLNCSLSDASSSPTYYEPLQIVISAAAGTTTAISVLPDLSLAVKKKATDLMPQLKGTSIFLVGMNNAVKTSLGKLLAETLRYYYFDSDNLVEEAAGGRSGLKDIGEEGFCESETEVLRQLSSMGRLVVCAGNGAVQSSTNLGLLRYGLSLWIDVPVSTETELDEEYEDLRGGYATADATISLQKVASKLGFDDLTAVTTEDMVLEVLKEIEKLTRVKKMIEAAATPF